jgi:hypothetical protein
MKEMILLLLLLLMQTSGLLAQNAGYPESPDGVVSEYLRLDAEGAELTKSGRASLQRLNPNNVEVNYSRTMNTPVISGYKILQTKLKGDKATAMVEYEVIGIATDYFFDFNPRAKKEKVEILLSRVDGFWRIETNIWPHMSAETVARHFEEIASTARKPESFKAVAQRIREMAKQPSKH